MDGQGGPAFHSNLIQVAPGTVLTGIMAQTGQANGLFSYNCYFQGIPNSGYAIQNVQQLTWFIVTLEAYSITKCSDYPNTADSSFREINLKSGNTNPAIAWSPVNLVTDCGQHAVVINNSSSNGEVGLYYHATAAWKHNDLTKELEALLSRPAIPSVTPGMWTKRNMSFTAGRTTTFTSFGSTANGITTISPMHPAIRTHRCAAQLAIPGM